MSRDFSQVKRVAAFSPSMLLAGIFQSTVHASKITGKSHQTIMYAANGKQVSALGYYWRFVPENVILDLDDLGKLSLMEFDRECGLERLVHKTTKWGYNDLVLSSSLEKCVHGKKKK